MQVDFAKAKSNLLYFVAKFLHVCYTFPQRAGGVVMAHMAKFKGAAAAHIIGHCERERSNEGYLKYHNGSEIDENRTKLNVSFYDQSGHKMLKNTA